MKKKLCVLISVLTLVFTLCGCVEIKDDSPYPKGGRDTVAEFGDRRFVILKGYTEDFIKEWRLVDREEHLTVEQDVYNYKDVKPHVYTIGLGGYTKLNYETGEYIKDSKLSSNLFSDGDKMIFIELESTKDNMNEIKFPSSKPVLPW